MTTQPVTKKHKKHRHKVVERSKFAIPSIITLLTMLCGFSSIILPLSFGNNNHNNYYFVWAAKLLILAGIFDGLDGRIARATNTATEFGVQLDSLADVLSFGMAPAILIYQYIFFQPEVIVSNQLRAIITLASFFFIACSAIRLARFNVQASFIDHRFFVGMPTPGGAACIVSIILYHPKQPTSTLLIYTIAIGLLLVGILMISNLRFPSSKKPSKQKRSGNLTTACMVILLLLAILAYNSFLLLLCITYLLVTLTINIGWKLGWQGVKPPAK